TAHPPGSDPSSRWNESALQKPRSSRRQTSKVHPPYPRYARTPRNRPHNTDCRRPEKVPHNGFPGPQRIWHCCLLSVLFVCADNPRILFSLTFQSLLFQKSGHVLNLIQKHVRFYYF